jgi:hypothetical protein
LRRRIDKSGDQGSDKPFEIDRLNKWGPLCLLAGTALALRNVVPAWVFMWMMAAAIFFGFKWITCERAWRAGHRAGPMLWIGYFLAWPGMDGESFLGSRNHCRKASTNQTNLLWAGLKVVLGLGLLWLAVSNRVDSAPLLKGWGAMLGLILILHFGLFDVLAFCWQRAGVDARPVMRAPVLSRSVSEFWGARWNTAFHDLAHTLAFRPLAGRLGVARATVLVFLISGFIHESVISLPARGGYGLPTAYFLLQGCGVLMERSRIGRRLGLNHGGRGRLFAWAVVALPAFWLFHPVFVLKVVLPMLAEANHLLKPL